MKTADLPDILLISVDSMRRDSMSPYGNDNMPFVSRLLSESVSFDNCFASSSWTGASFGSLHTGLWPRQHKCLSTKSNADEKRKGSLLDSKVPTLAEILSNSGYHTICSQGNPCHVGRQSGFDHGFDDFFGWNYDWNLPRVKRELKAFASAFKNGRFLHYSSFFCQRLLESLKLCHFTPAWPMTEGKFIAKKALNMLARLPEDKPVFAWVNFMDMHSPYPVPGHPLPKVPTKIKYYHKQPRVYPEIEYSESDRITTRMLYENSAAYIDDQIDAMLNTIKEIRTKRSTLTIFVSDHGEEFWDHGNDGKDPYYYNTGVEHGHTLYNELLAVPFFVHWPGVVKSSRKVSDVVSLIDIVPTITELLGLAKPDCGYAATSLADRITSESDQARPDRVVFAESLAYGPERKAAISSTHKLIYCPETDQKELYAWAADDGEEKIDLSDSPDHKAVLDGLFAEMKKWDDATNSGNTDVEMIEEDDEVAKQLRALGYL